MVLHIAVLDDYHGIASSYYSKLDLNQYAITYLPETQRPYNHTDTSQTDKDKLAESLALYDIIGKPVVHLIHALSALKHTFIQQP